MSDEKERGYIAIIALIAAFSSAISVPVVAQTPDFFARYGDGKVEESRYVLTHPAQGPSITGEVRLRYRLSATSPGHGELTESVQTISFRQTFSALVDETREEHVLNSESPIQVWSSSTRGLRAITPVVLRGVFSDSTGPVQIVVAGPEAISLTHGESEQDRRLPVTSYTVFEDDLLLRVREQVASFPSGSYDLLPSLVPWRGTFLPKLVRIRVKRGVKVTPVMTVVGSIPARSFTIMLPARTWRIRVEDGGQRRVLGWEIEIRNEGAVRHETARLRETRWISGER